MGWFSNIIGPVLKVGAGVFLGEAAAEAVGSFLGEEPAMQIEKAATVSVAGTGAAGIRGVPIGDVQAALAAGRTIVPSVAIAGTPGARPIVAGGAIAIAGTKNIVTTIVETRNATGQLIRTETLKGAPFLMKTDIVAAKRVHKKFVKLGQKLPRRTVQQSQASKLTEAIQDKAMQQILGPSCPPKC